METKKEDKKVNIKIGVIDLPKIDVVKYIGKKSKIESADTFEGTFGYYVKVLTKSLETIGSGDKEFELRGSKILGLQQDENGKWGYGIGTKLDLFLKKYKCNEVKDLIGKEVILQTTTSKTSDVEFLTFN